jgi:MarR family transcriptional regulator, organic hydroperoxide resistance regulator
LRRHLERRLSAEGLDYGSWYFLRILWVEEGFTQAELCERTGLSQPTAAAALRKMRQGKLISLTADPHDRRASHIFLTEKARAMKPRFAALIDESHRRATVGVSKSDLATVRKVLRKIRENCDKADNVW